MSTRLSNASGAAMAFGIVVFVVWAVIKGVQEAPVIVGSFATALAAVVAVVYQKDLENRREIERAHREQLVPLYESLFERFSEGVDFSDPDQQDFMLKFQRKLILYGSDCVVRDWVTWLRSIPTENDQTDDGDPTVLLTWATVLFAIRRDLGHKSEGLTARDLLRVYIHDIDEHIAAG